MLSDTQRIWSSASGPSDLAFLAMSHFKLGLLAEADKYRAQFKEVMKLDRCKDDVENRGFADEVEEVFSDKSE